MCVCRYLCDEYSHMRDKQETVVASASLSNENYEQKQKRTKATAEDEQKRIT